MEEKTHGRRYKGVEERYQHKRDETDETLNCKYGI